MNLICIFITTFDSVHAVQLWRNIKQMERVVRQAQLCNTYEGLVCVDILL